MRVSIEPAVLGRLLNIHRRVSAIEPCALLVGVASADSILIEAAIEAPNVHPKPDRAFAVGPAVLFEAARRARAAGRSVVGAWHGHGARRADLSVADHAAVRATGVTPGAGGVAEAAPFVYVVSGRGAGRSIVVRAFVASRGGVVDTPLHVASRRDRVLATARSMDLLSVRPAVSA
jgi:proteasome lid subunit RPN8/RPN11